MVSRGTAGSPRHTEVRIFKPSVALLGMEFESTLIIDGGIAADAAVAVVKFDAAVLTGSSSAQSGAIHSVDDNMPTRACCR